MASHVVKWKTVIICLGLVCLGYSVWWGYGLSADDDLRVSWFETTRRKLLLYEGITIDLFATKKIEQSFVAKYPGLSQIDVLIKQNDTPQNIVFRLKAQCDSTEDIVFTSTELPRLSEPTFYPFTFSPLDDSTGQNYCLVLEAPETTRQNAIRLQISAGDLYPYGQLKVFAPQALPDEQPLSPLPTPPAGANPGRPYKIYLPIVARETGGPINTIEDIGFRLHYNGRLLPTFQVFVARLTANKPYFWGDPWFYGGLLIIYSLLLSGLFYVARKTTHLEES